MNKKQKRFTVLAGLLLAVVIGTACGAGWFVWQANKDTDDALKNTGNKKVILQQPVVAKEVDSEKTNYKIPEGYRFYNVKELGIKLAYPKDFGDFNDSSSERSGIVKAEESFYLKTPNPNPSVVEGSSDGLGIVMLESPEEEFYTVKYGPTVHFDDDKLIVTDVNPADRNNKIGAEYVNFFSDANVKSKVNGITVYQITGGDEGITRISFTFKIDNNVGIILLPAFNDGDSMCPTNDCRHYDISEYNELAKNILSSLQRS